MAILPFWIRGSEPLGLHPPLSGMLVTVTGIPFLHLALVAIAELPMMYSRNLFVG